MEKIFEESIDVFALTKEGTRKYYDNLYNKLINEGKDIVDYQSSKQCLLVYFVPRLQQQSCDKNGLQDGPKLSL